jgi:hypothetical protein
VTSEVLKSGPTQIHVHVRAWTCVASLLLVSLSLKPLGLAACLHFPPSGNLQMFVWKTSSKEELRFGLLLTRL